jgi:hypothetical protein
MVDVPHVELDPVCPRQRRATVNLRPAGEPRLDVEAPALVVAVPIDLVPQRRARADQRHVPANDVPELRQLVERQLPEGATDARDACITAVDGKAGSLALRADDHRPELQELEVAATLADAHLPVEDGPPVLELDAERGEREQRRRQDEHSRR